MELTKNILFDFFSRKKQRQFESLCLTLKKHTKNIYINLNKNNTVILMNNKSIKLSYQVYEKTYVHLYTTVWD